MKKIALALMVAGICAAPSIASAKTSPYVRVAGGIGMMNNSKETNTNVGIPNVITDSDFKTGIALEGAVGLKMDMFRVEAATGYQSSEVDSYRVNGVNQAFSRTYTNYNNVTETITDKFTTSIRSYMINGYADFDLGGSITPYAMAGLGIANVEVKEHSEYNFSNGVSQWNDDSFTEDVFAWQIGAGIGFKASENVTVDLGYRYFAASDVILSEDETISSIATSNILLGVSYGF
jgi:opacity protein-like surface antigen